jgi:DNA-binding XRE family transcriptional regulator
MARSAMCRAPIFRGLQHGIVPALGSVRRYSPTENEDWGKWLRRLGGAMRDLRESLGLPQEELASRAGVSQGSVSRFENGCSSHIGALVVLKLAATLVRQCRGPKEPLLLDALKGILEEFGWPGFPPPATGRDGASRQTPPSTRHNAFVQEGDTWTIVHQGSILLVRDSKGIRYIAELLRNPGRDISALVLLAAGGPPGSNDVDGARPPATERARLSVTRAIRRALFRIATMRPSLGQQLQAALRTGAHCAYRPEPHSSTAWIVETDLQRQRP